LGGFAGLQNPQKRAKLRWGHLLPKTTRRFAQVRARKLAEAAASVNDLLLSASSALAAAATTPAAASARNGGGGEGADPEAGPEPASSAAEVEAQVGVAAGAHMHERGSGHAADCKSRRSGGLPPR
jgi:hypothetical protein